MNETDHNIDELRADQKGVYLIPGTFWKTFSLINPSSLCIENVVYQLLRLFVIDFVKISRVKLFLWSALSSDSFTHIPLCNVDVKPTCKIEVAPQAPVAVPPVLYVLARHRNA